MNTCALTMHGWHVSTLTKLGTAAAAMSLNNMNRWSKCKVRNTFFPFFHLLWNNISFRFLCTDAMVDISVPRPPSPSQCIQQWKHIFWRKGEIVGWEKEYFLFLYCFISSLYFFKPYPIPTPIKSSVKFQPPDWKWKFHLRLVTQTTIKNRGWGHRWSNAPFHFHEFSGAWS